MSQHCLASFWWETSKFYGTKGHCINGFMPCISLSLELHLVSFMIPFQLIIIVVILECLSRLTVKSWIFPFAFLLYLTNSCKLMLISCSSTARPVSDDNPNPKMEPPSSQPPSVPSEQTENQSKENAVSQPAPSDAAAPTNAENNVVGWECANCPSLDNNEYVNCYRVPSNESHLMIILSLVWPEIEIGIPFFLGSLIVMILCP